MNIYLTKIRENQMRITGIATNQYFSGSTNNKKETFLEKFHSRTKNSADMTDTIVVPRTIFKGYLGIMSGTTLVTLGGLFNKHPKVNKSLMTAGLLTSLYGTWAFVRPFIVKDAPGVETGK